MRIPIVNLDSVGILADLHDTDLPLNAWSSGKNVRFRNGRVEKTNGWVESFTPSIDANFLLPVRAPVGNFWLYAGDAKAYAYKDGTSTNITRMAGDYLTAGQTWTGGVLNGIPVLNNGVDVPQMWTPPQESQRLQALSNWPTGWRCKSLRPFKNYLVALNMTKDAVHNPYMVSWSHLADPGQVPDSWDPADETRDAGDFVVADTDGHLLDQGELRGSNILYKTDSVHRMEFIGGVAIFGQRKILEAGTGLLVPNGVQKFRHKGEWHLVMGPNDIYVHDGVNADSILRKRMRDWVYNDIDSENYTKSYVVHNWEQHEIWICYPQATQEYPNVAVVWNYADDTTSIRDIPSAAFIQVGRVNDVAGVVDDSWDSDDSSWDSDNSPWGQGAYRAVGSRLLMVTHGAGRKAYIADYSAEAAGSPIHSFVERTGLCILGKASDGKPIYDTDVVKTVTEVWPRLRGAVGTVIDIYVGAQMKEQDPIEWQGPFPFVVGTDEKVDPYISGKILGIRFENTSGAWWELGGYDLEIVGAGKY